MEHSNLRKKEIVEACAQLYNQYSFKEITIKLISEHTSFSRPSIYNYFETKEEIFLALFQSEYEKWQIDINNIKERNITLTKEEFAKKLATTLSKRKKLLKLLSMNLYDMEENSRLERLVEFKKSYANTINSVKQCLNKFFKASEEEQNKFIYTFFPYILGIYPYTFITEKQKKAMEQAGIVFYEQSIYDIAYRGIKKLLG